MKPGDDGRDAELRSRLQETLPDPPLDAVDWAGLHGRIMARSAPLLAGARGARAPRTGVWQTLSGWSRRGIPLSGLAAAAAAAVLVLGYAPQRPAPAPAAALPTMEEELADGSITGSLLAAGTTDDDLLAALLFYEEGER